MLEGITICGGDDSIGPHMLALLGRRYPFIEWGILMSRDRVGTARYPSINWINQLCKRYEKLNGFGLCAHLCGEMARVTASGDRAYLMACNYKSFRRVQLNGAKQIGRSFLALTQEFSELEFVLQAPRVELVEIAAGLGLCCRPGRVAALYDPSGGRGMRVGVYPQTPPGFHVGFAGGIGPENILEVIARIGERPDPYWLCMESGVRTNDAFDVEKIEAVGAKVGEYLAGEIRRRLGRREACA